VEALVPVDSGPLRDRLDEMLSIDLADDALAWELEGTGRWRRVPVTRGLNAQRELQDLAVQRARAGEPRA
jgi:polyphosphate kinase